jgi:Polyketide cyclase / dehydrase and lipid transport
MLKKILIGVGAVLALLVVVILMQPATFHIERSINMAAPPDAAFAQVNDFHAWRAWSPWEKLDPSLKRSYDGAPAGVGAKYAWVGSKEVGEGRMTIEKSSPSEVAIKLEFLKPFAATNTATFTFTKTAEGNKTTWAMDGNNNFMSKAFHLVMNMDKMIGPDFERGLAAMKTAAEAAPQAAPSVAATP